MSNNSANTSGSPRHQQSTSLAGTSLQIPATRRDNQSSRSTQRSFDQSSSSKSRASTRQSAMSSSTASNWTSVSGISKASTNSSLKPYFYPTSGYPKSNVLQQAYPGSGYPVSHLHHSYGYPSNNFPCCEVPGATDFNHQLLYPSSEFPGSGAFPGEIQQDDGSAPFINGFEPEPSDPAAPFLGGGLFPGGQTLGSFPAADSMYTPASFDPRYGDGGGYSV